MAGINHYLILSAILFSIGLTGALVKRNIVTVLMAVELMFNAAILAFLAFARFAPQRPEGLDAVITSPLLTGHLFALFIIVVAAAEVALGLAIVISLYRDRETVDVTTVDSMKG